MDTFDFEYLTKILNSTHYMGSDTAPGNLFLLKDRYKIQLEKKQSFLLRHFDYSDSIRGYAFPLPLKGSADFNLFNILKDYFLYVTDDLKKSDVNLCLFSSDQKKDFDALLTSNFPEYKIEWKTNSADSDYIYLQTDLENLSGKKLQKKKNHISKFNRTYANSSFVYFDKTNFSQRFYDDFILVADNWIKEQYAKNEQKEINTYESEKKSIEAALSNIAIFDFFGGLLYIKDMPVAITLASKISDDVLDIHFEKCLSEAAAVGGYSVINNSFIKHCTSYHYINREEDLGIEGLRKAKLSYKPEIILEKYYGRLIRN